VWNFIAKGVQLTITIDLAMRTRHRAIAFDFLLRVSLSSIHTEDAYGFKDLSSALRIDHVSFSSIYIQKTSTVPKDTLPIDFQLLCACLVVGRATVQKLYNVTPQTAKWLAVLGRTRS